MINLSREEISRYARQIVLPEVGLEGQKKLKASSVLVIGAGGLGSPVALYLAAAGIGRIGIVDFDVVEKGNLHRQVLHSDRSVGKSKVSSAVSRLEELNPDIQVEGINEVFKTASAARIADGYDILVDATDNFPTRYLVNDLCVLTKRPFVHGSVYRFEGQAGTYQSGVGPCYRCIFPVPPPAESAASCAVTGVLGAIPGIIGSIQASEVVKIILGIGGTLTGRLLVVDAAGMDFQTVRYSKDPDCAVCGNHPSISELIVTEIFCGSSILPGQPAAGPDMTVLELQTSLTSKVPLQILDVREPGEWQISDIEGAVHIRLSELKSRRNELNPDLETVVYCRSGIRSMMAVEILTDFGFSKVTNLRGGINAWVKEIDSSQTIY